MRLVLERMVALEVDDNRFEVRPKSKKSGYRNTKHLD